MVQKKRSITILAFDQSLAHTGIVVGRYNRFKGPGKILGCIEGPTKSPWKLIELFRELTVGNRRRLPCIEVVVREDAYFSASTPEGGLETERTGGWAEMLGSIAYPFADIYHVKASVWREAVWGQGMGWAKRDVAKKHTLGFARAHGFEEGAGNEHLADALGILCWAGIHYFEEDDKKRAKEESKESRAARKHKRVSPEKPETPRDDGQCTMQEA